MRIVDRFYAYCQAVARRDDLRETLAHSQQAAKRSLWTMLIVGSLLCYYLADRVAQAMSLF